MVECHPISANILSRLHKLGPSVLPFFLWICVIRGRNLARRHNGRRHWRIGGDGRIWTPRPKAQCKGSVKADERWQFHDAQSQMERQIFWRRSGCENIHLNPGQPRPRRRTRKDSRRIRRGLLQPHVKTHRGMMVKPKCFWVYLRRFHLPSSRGTQSQTVRAERRINPYCTETHWSYQDCRHNFRCDVGKTY